MAYGATLIANLGVFFWILIILVIIDVILKGFAMWRAAGRNSKVWFWVLLVFNTLGILPLIYLIATMEKRNAESVKKKRI